MFKKLINFGKSLSFHIGNGMPKSTQEEINQRFAICEECSSFDKDNEECKICGCNINKKRIFMNKLAWKDTSCPMSKW
jgi:rRNA maturation endonuclease Nob1